MNDKWHSGKKLKMNGDINVPILLSAMSEEIDKFDLTSEFMAFAKLAKRNYDNMIAAGNHECAEILESAWHNVCMAGTPEPRKILGFCDTDAMSLVMLRDARDYLAGGIDVDGIKKCTRYLKHLSEPRPLREYIASFTTKYLDPWSVHVDATYVYCKLRVSGIVSNLLSSDDPAIIDKCRIIDNWVLSNIRPCFADKYIRLADNRTTFATVKQFCMYAIDTKRNNQEYLCELINLIDRSGAVKLVPVASGGDNIVAVPPEIEPTPICSQISSDDNSEGALTKEDIENTLHREYVLRDIIVIARALRINPKRPKNEIIKNIVDILAHRSCDPQYIKAIVSVWRMTCRNSKNSRNKRNRRIGA